MDVIPSLLLPSYYRSVFEFTRIKFFLLFYSILLQTLWFYSNLTSIFLHMTSTLTKLVNKTNTNFLVFVWEIFQWTEFYPKLSILYFQEFLFNLMSSLKKQVFCSSIYLPYINILNIIFTWTVRYLHYCLKVLLYFRSSDTTAILFYNELTIFEDKWWWRYFENCPNFCGRIYHYLKHLTWYAFIAGTSIFDRQQKIFSYKIKYHDYDPKSISHNFLVISFTSNQMNTTPVTVNIFFSVLDDIIISLSKNYTPEIITLCLSQWYLQFTTK